MTRTISTLGLLAALVLAQGAGEAAARPESKPEGEPVELKVVLEAGMVQDFEMRMTMEMSSGDLGMQVVTEIDMSGRLEVGEQHGDAYAVTMSMQVDRATANGEDVLPMLKAQMGSPVVHGRLHPTDGFVEGTVRVEGVHGPMRDQMAQQVESFYGYLPPEPVRAGEVWDVPLEEFTKGMAGAGLEGGETEGEVWQQLAGFEEIGGARCARVASGGRIVVSGDALRFPNVPQPVAGRIEMVLASTTHHGLDGITRKTIVDVEMDMRMTVPGAPQAMQMTNNMSMVVRMRPVEKEAAETDPEGSNDGR